MLRQGLEDFKALADFVAPNLCYRGKEECLCKANIAPPQRPEPFASLALMMGMENKAHHPNDMLLDMNNHILLTRGDANATIQPKRGNLLNSVKEEKMKKLGNLHQPPFNTCLVGAVKGALDYFECNVSAAATFGGSGHAFLVNIHEQLCPSGPYCWKYEEFYPLVRNLGVEMVELGFCHNGSTPEERAAMEQKVRECLDQGQPCAVGNMDNQLICGYEDNRFLMIQPWDTCCSTTPPSLIFGTWAEFGEEIHATFWTFRKVPAKDEPGIVRDSLRYALDLFQNPEKHSFEHYATGLAAYDNWAKAVETGHGASHGSWWNAMVWSECRAMAGAWFEELATKHSNISSQARKLSEMYKEIAAKLEKVSNKEMDPSEKVRIVHEVKTMEQEAISNIKNLLAAFDR